MRKWIDFYYYKYNFSIIPLEKSGKKPNITRWNKYQYQKPTKEEIEEWYEKGLFENIGVICGAVSNIVVLDIDDASLVDDLGLKLDQTVENNWVVKTGRGYHIYMKPAGDIGDTCKYDKLKLEHRSNGAYVVAPPSIHPNSSKYQFMNAKEPEDLADLLPAHTMKIFQELVGKAAKLKGIEIKTTELPEPIEHIEADCVAKMWEGAEKGSRNDTAYALANYYFHVKKLSADETKAILIKWNFENKPSMKQTELDTVVNSVLSNGKKSGCRKIKELGYCPYKTKRDCRFINPNAVTRDFIDAPKDLEEVYKRLRKWLFLPHTEQVDLVLAVALSTFSDDKPLWLFLVSSSGNSKSEIVKTLDGLPFVRKVDTITPNTLASGKEDVPDLGSELANKHTLLLFTDLASLTSLSSDQKKQIWGQFRNLYDGEIYKDTGSGVNKKYENCHVTMLACGTSAIKDDFHINQQLGTREILYGIPSRYEDDRQKMKAALTHKGQEELMKKEMAAAMQGYLAQKEFDPTIDLPEHIVEFLMRKSMKLKILRAPVSSTDWYSGELQSNAEPETPTRLIQQFSLLYRCLHSLEDDYDDDKFKGIVENIIRSSSHPVRYEVYEFFKDNLDVWFKVPQVQEGLRMGYKAVKSQCECLWNLRVLQRKTEEERIGGFLHVDADGNESMRGGRVQDVYYYRMIKPIEDYGQTDLKVK